MDATNNPRILIITLKPLSKTSSNKVFASFFKGYPKSAIAQLYFHREIPTSDVCDNYYKISDEDIVNFLMKRKKALGEKVLSEEAHLQDSEERIVPVGVNNFLKKSGMIRFIKESLMLRINFENEALNDWLEAFSPEVIFFCGGARSHVCNLALKISEKFNAKIIQYVTDDYVLPYFSLNIFSVINRYLTRKAFIKICMKSSLILTTGDKLSKVYREKYAIESKKLMPLIDIDVSNMSNNIQKENDLRFIYTGGLHCDRWKPLVLIGKSLERLEKQGFKGRLEIYTSRKPDKKMLTKINNKNYSKYCGSLDKEGVKRVLKEADVLVHVESFDRKSKKITYLSVSTKVPEYLSSGRCILAFGPEDVASIEYFAETKSAFVVTCRDNSGIDEKIKDIFTNKEKREYYIEQAMATAIKNHNATSKVKEFQEDILSLMR